RDDAGEVAVTEAPRDVLEQAAGRRVAGPELGERVALQSGDTAGEKERQPDGRSGHLSCGAEQGKDPGADHGADPDERGLPDRPRGRWGAADRTVRGHQSPSAVDDVGRLNMPTPL